MKFDQDLCGTCDMNSTLGSVVPLAIFFKIFVIETNLDSIILCELEIFVDRDLSIIGRVRLVKKTCQSWGQKVGVILKVG